MSKFADWLEKYRVVIGCITTVLLLAVGGLLVWIDWHPPASQATSTSTVVKRSVEAGPTKTTTSTSVSTAPTSSAVPSQTGLVNINNASVTQLDSLPGIGPTYASRIVEYRTANGAFASTRDVVKVKGIGEATYAKIKDKITVGGN